MSCLENELALGQNEMFDAATDYEIKQMVWLFTFSKYLRNENDSLLVYGIYVPIFICDSFLLKSKYHRLNHQ